MKQYLDTVRHVLETGTRKENRTGVDTLSTFGHYYEHDLRDGFPLLTTKSVSWKNIVVELLWFLSGQTDIGILQRHGCKFWDAWADESAGNAQTSKLPPCHCLFTFNVQNEPIGGQLNASTAGSSSATEMRQRLCLHLTQRSCDVALGVPYNLASYALLLHLFSHFTGIEPGIFGHTLIDAHVYTSKSDGSKAEYDHVPGLRHQLERTPRRLPKLVISTTIRDLKDVEALMDPKLTTDEVMKHFVLEGYDPHPAIPFKVAV
jgi:thymidylate synthase